MHFPVSLPPLSLAGSAYHFGKVMLKILHARLQQYTNRELPDVQAEKADEPEIKFPTSIGSSKKHQVAVMYRQSAA